MALVTKTIDESILKAPLATCAMTCLEVLLAYTAYRDIYEHQTGNRALSRQQVLVTTSGA